MSHSEIQPLEQEILNDIEATTGYRFHRIGGINPRDRCAAEVALPVLWTWLERVGDKPNFRGAIYMAFAGPAGRSYFDGLLAWLRRENDRHARPVLKNVLLALVTSGTAEPLWHEILEDFAFPVDFHFAIEMMKYCSTRASAVQTTLDFLATIAGREAEGNVIEGFAQSAMDALSRVCVPEVREWFAGYTNSRDPQLRLLARRAAGLPFKLPPGYRMVERECDLSRELYSTELDLTDLGGLARTLASEFGVKIPEGLDSEAVKGMLAEDRWIVCKGSASGKNQLSIWLRREDDTTVEVRVLRN